jgi:hypothetical protein
MTLPGFVRAVAVAFVAAAFAGSAAPAAEAPTLMGSFKAWFVYSVGADRTRVCYALARPANSTPKGARRDPIYIIISTWPARGIRNEPSVVPGYPYKDGSTVEISVGNDKFTLFTQNQGTNGGAWIKSSEDEARLIQAMKGGISMRVTGTSRRGTVTRDEYSLAGISAALDAIANACK